MSPNIYFKIDNTNTIVNTQLAFSTDYFDPSYTWVIMTSPPQVCTDGVTLAQIGCTYDGTNFYAAVQS